MLLGSCCKPLSLLACWQLARVALCSDLPSCRCLLLLQLLVGVGLSLLLWPPAQFYVDTQLQGAHASRGRPPLLLLVDWQHGVLQRQLELCLLLVLQLLVGWPLGLRRLLLLVDRQEWGLQWLLLLVVLRLLLLLGLQHKGLLRLLGLLVLLLLMQQLRQHTLLPKLCERWAVGLPPWLKQWHEELHAVWLAECCYLAVVVPCALQHLLHLALVPLWWRERVS